MNMIVLNGSPKANIKESNTEIFINEFMKDMKKKYPIKYIARENHEELSYSLKDYDTVLIFLPLYIHAMPGIMMKFIEELDEGIMSGKNLGILIQAEFPETAQEKYVVRYFEELSKELKCNYIGTVCKGEAAAAYIFPKKYRKLFKNLNELGRKFEDTGEYDKSIAEQIAYPYNLSDYSLFTRGAIKVSPYFYKIDITEFTVYYSV